METRTAGGSLVEMVPHTDHVPLMDAAYAHVHTWLSSPFVWGDDDCMLSLANYLMRLGHPDIGAKWRGMYDSILTCQRATKFMTDAVSILADGVAIIGLERTETPVKGDIGVVMFEGYRYPVGAIFLGLNWAVRGEYKVNIGQASHVLAAWRVVPHAG